MSMRNVEEVQRHLRKSINLGLSTDQDYLNVLQAIHFL